MAQVLREAGRYVGPEAVEKRRRVLAAILVLTALCFGIAGFLVGNLLRKSPLWTHALTFLILMVLLRLAFVLAERKIEGLEQDRKEMRKGAQQEDPVETVLRALPDEFYIINDLTTPLGKIDHVVLGPTGVFVINEKNWKGMVTANSNGELLWNGHPTDEPLVEQFVGTVIGMEEQVRAALPGSEVRCEPLFVFTSAHVEMAAGSTGSLRCIVASQLRDHIAATKPEPKLENADKIAEAFLALAEIQGDLAGKRAPDMPET